MPVGTVDLIDARSHKAGELEQGDSGGDRERCTRMPERVRCPMRKPCRLDGRRPLVRPPAVQVEEAAARPGKEQRSIESRRDLCERLGGSERQRNGAKGAARLAVE